MIEPVSLLFARQIQDRHQNAVGHGFFPGRHFDFPALIFRQFGYPFGEAETISEGIGTRSVGAGFSRSRPNLFGSAGGDRLKPAPTDGTPQVLRKPASIGSKAPVLEVANPLTAARGPVQPDNMPRISDLSYRRGAAIDRSPGREPGVGVTMKAGVPERRTISYALSPLPSYVLPPLRGSDVNVTERPAIFLRPPHSGTLSPTPKFSPMVSRPLGGSYAFPASAKFVQNFVKIPQPGSSAPLHLPDQPQTSGGRAWPEHVAAGFTPAFNFQQIIFPRDLNAGIKPEATSIRTLDSYQATMELAPMPVPFVERLPFDTPDSSVDLTLRAPQAVVSSISEGLTASTEHVPAVPRTVEVPARSVMPESREIAKQLSVPEVAEQVYRLLERRLVIDKERRGIF